MLFQLPTRLADPLAGRSHRFRGSHGARDSRTELPRFAFMVHVEIRLHQALA